MLPLCPKIRWPSAHTPMIALAIPTKVKMAFRGTCRDGSTRPIQRGSRPSRPALKISRACEFTAAMSTPRVEVSPARYAKKARLAAAPWATVMKGTRIDGLVSLASL